MAGQRTSGKMWADQWRLRQAVREAKAFGRQCPPIGNERLLLGGTRSPMQPTSHTKGLTKEERMARSVRLAHSLDKTRCSCEMKEDCTEAGVCFRALGRAR
jgi:hypothetical protein